MSAGRPYVSTGLGATAGAISFDSIDRYASRFEIYDDEFVRFLALIKAMDQHYLSETQKRQQKAQKAKK